MLNTENTSATPLGWPSRAKAKGKPPLHLAEPKARSLELHPRLLSSLPFPSLPAPTDRPHNHEAMNKTSRTALIAICIFALPFGGAGIAAVTAGLRGLAEGKPNAIVGVLVGGIFTLVAAGMVTAALVGIRKFQKISSLQAEHPVEPWMWREDWAHGRADTTGSNLVTAWVFATFWNMIAWTSIAVIPLAQYQRKPVTLLVVLFPIVGIGLLIWAVRVTLARLEFGKTFLELGTLPAPLGREFRGTIHTRFLPPIRGDLRVKLSCVNRYTTGSGDNRSTTEKILWREEQTISASSVFPGPQGTMIPVSFRVPLDQRPTDSSNPNSQIVWVIEAAADVPGVDYKDVFEVPVFRTKDTPERADARFVSAPAQEASAHPPAHATIAVRPAAEGGTEFYFGAARNPGFAIGLTTFMAIWTGAIVLMLKLGAPWLFACAFGLFDLLFLYIALDLWCGTSRVVAQSGTLLVQKGWLGSGKVRTIAACEIADLQSKITAQQGGATGTPYYSLQLVLNSGRTVTLGENVRNKEEAEWLAAEMRRIASVKPRTMATTAADPAATLASMFGSLRRN
jgi:hypothetical protein